jgi:hypothetical protein
MYKGGVRAVDQLDVVCRGTGEKAQVRGGWVGRVG